MNDPVNETSPEVVEKVVDAFLEARRKGATKLSAYMIARAVYRQYCPDDPINRPIIFSMIEAAERRATEERPQSEKE
ncbi:MAG: hypothetical protein CMM58_12915 [Rhodospirillaceae bacterium]|nr:hypothetical protein [Rhodospirillaceae bacterium]|tara:strand:+ start:359 stop:589 length:231 start_codon:yes stop_codon:yes gene_type:complete